jgi:uncharacterized protein YlxW (UPF0749 family)
MGLLNYITAHSLDEDYSHARELRGDQAAGARRPGRASLVVLAAFGVLVTTAGVQTARTAGVAESSRDNLVAQVNSGKKVLDRSRASLARLQADVASAQRSNSAANARRAAAEASVQRLGLVLGGTSVSGPGVRMVVDDARDPTSDKQLVLDSDLRDIANGLWQAGAEAISINGQRLTTTSAISIAGRTINVNYEKVVPPYTVLAIGDPDVLQARFAESTTGSYWLNNQRTFSLRFEMTSEDSVIIPAVDPKRLRLRQAKSPAVEGAS